VTAVVLFAVLAGVGAVARGTVTWRWNLARGLPLGTLAANVAGCLVLGVLHGSGLAPPALTVVGTGLVGAFTTFSGFVADTAGLAVGDRKGAAAAYVVVSLVAGVAAATLGRALGG
jgi:fluoride exporter